jgi:diacylglycerol kinase (ATP)
MRARSEQPRTLSIKIDEGDWQEIKDVNCLAVCNGVYFGSGMKVAPGADVSDALFDVTVWAGFGVLDFVLLSPLIYSGEHLNHEKTTSFRCTSLEVRAAGGAEGVAVAAGDAVAVELDGETPGALPASFRVLPSVIHFLA